VGRWSPPGTRRPETWLEPPAPQLYVGCSASWANAVRFCFALGRCYLVSLDIRLAVWRASHDYLPNELSLTSRPPTHWLTGSATASAETCDQGRAASTEWCPGRQNWITPLTPTPARVSRAFGRTLLGERRRPVLCRPPVGLLAAERTQLLQTALGSPRSPN
jgi:hypothetical protein